MIIEEYKDTLARCIQMYYPISKQELDPILDYSVRKRFKDSPCSVVNNYTNKTSNMTLMKLSEYIAKRQPIVTAAGTMFARHGDVPNPMADVVQQFLDQRKKDKAMMFQFPKGSEEFEKYNLLQQLDKIDVNGLYGTLGMYTSLLYNINVASSVTTSGRAAISALSMCFESFLSNNVKFGSLNEVVQFIDHICNERPKRQYNDYDILDHLVTTENCFAKIIDSCGYRWIPDEEEMDIIWRIVSNLGQGDLNRVYYKNNLYEFVSNIYMKKVLVTILKTLKTPYFNPMKCPKEIESQLEELVSILKEYVYYDKMYIDRIDRCDSMMKSVIMISDTDSCIVSVDAWYRFVLELVRYEDLQIKKYDPMSPIEHYDRDEFGEFVNKELMDPLDYIYKEEDYDFYNDEIIEKAHTINPLNIIPQDCLRYSIINIMSYVLDAVINDYMVEFSKNNHSYKEGKKCRLTAKNEFLFKRALLTSAKKSYATLQEVQEGNIIPKDKQLDVKGIASMAKSSMADSTRNALKKILLEDIMNAPTIDQFKIIKHIALLEKKITDSIQSGSKEYYKPATVKSSSAYENPMSIQGIKGSVVWNALKTDDLPGINLDERNAVSIAKCYITEKSVQVLKDKYPTVYENALAILKEPVFKGKIDSIAIPLEVSTPDWIMEIIDYKSIINDNISGFPIESVGIMRLGNNNVNYTNILQL